MSFQKSENLKTPFKGWIRKSNRSLAEQIVGLMIFLTLSLLSWLCVHWFNFTYHPFTFDLFWVLPSIIFGNITIIFYAFIGTSVWFLWRSQTIRKLKLEVSLFLLNLAFSLGWHAVFLVLQETLLSLIVLLFLLSISLISFYVFWKKEKVAGLLLLPFVLWVTYAIFVNMELSLNP